MGLGSRCILRNLAENNRNLAENNKKGHIAKKGCRPSLKDPLGVNWYFNQCKIMAEALDQINFESLTHF